MAGLWIAHVEVTDEETYGRYLPGASAAVAAHGGTFIARGGRYEQLEGHEYARNVVVRFDTYEDALACYHSEEYQAVVGLAIEGSNRTLVIVEADL